MTTRRDVTTSDPAADCGNISRNTSSAKPVRTAVATIMGLKDVTRGICIQYSRVAAGRYRNMTGKGNNIFDKVETGKGTIDDGMTGLGEA